MIVFVMGRRLKIGQIACSSEWALTKFFESLRTEEINEKYSLEFIAGIEPTEREAVRTLLEGMAQKFQLMENNPNFRGGQFLKIINNSTNLLTRLNNGEIAYIHVNGDNSLPEELHEGLDAIVIHSSNLSHLGYVEDAAKHGTHVICEKPLVPVLDSKGNSDWSYFNRLKKVTNEADVHLINAEHYSVKPSSCYFYNQFKKLVGGRKIVGIEGALLELDDPKLPRTKDILSLRNQTGLMGDTMCHLAAFVSNLGGVLIPVDREFAKYSEFDVDTYNNVKYEIEDTAGNFGSGARAKFVIGKFIDKFVDPMDEESKYMNFELDDCSNIRIDFRSGEFRVDDFVLANGANPFHSNEYVNLLNSFYSKVHGEDVLMTSFESSLNTIESTLRAYELPPEHNREVRVYG